MTFLVKILLLLTLVQATYAEDSSESQVHSLIDPRIQHLGWILDESRLLTTSGKQERINQMISSLENDTGNEIMIVILPSIGEQNPKQFAIELFEKWKIGKSKKDNGLLVLHVLDQRRIELETGYGLEGILTDVTCKNLLEKKVIPYFKQGAYSTGHESLILTLNAMLRHSESDIFDIEHFQTNLPKPEDAAIDRIPNLIPSENSAPYAKTGSLRIFSLYLAGFGIFLYLFYPLILFRYASRWKTKYYLEYERKEIFDLWSLFIYGCASISLIASVTLLHQSFLGSHLIYLTLFLGSVAIVAITFYSYLKLYKLWESYVRDAKILCSKCSSQMDRLMNQEKYYAHLSENERTEKEIRSYKFDLYECKKCKHIDTFRYPGSDFPLYSDCHVCHCRSLFIEKKTTKFPTLSATGLAEISCLCKKCGFQENKTESIPISEDFTQDSSHSSSTGSSGSSYSSSDDSSSSTSGGSSGGGGAGSSY